MGAQVAAMTAEALKDRLGLGKKLLPTKRSEMRRALVWWMARESELVRVMLQLTRQS